VPAVLLGAAAALVSSPAASPEPRIESRPAALRVPAPIMPAALPPSTVHMEPAAPAPSVEPMRAVPARPTSVEASRGRKPRARLRVLPAAQPHANEARQPEPPPASTSAPPAHGRTVHPLEDRH